MAAKIRFEMNRKGIRQAALVSQEVRDLIAKTAENTATRARSETDVEVFVQHAGESRARSYVGIRSAAVEAKERIIGRALPGGDL